jgi:hypothetical protein
VATGYEAALLLKKRNDGINDGQLGFSIAYKLIGTKLPAW